MGPLLRTPGHSKGERWPCPARCRQDLSFETRHASELEGKKDGGVKGTKDLRT